MTAPISVTRSLLTHQHLPPEYAVGQLVGEFDSASFLRRVSEAAEWTLDHPEVFLSFVLWQLALLYAIPVLFWDFELGVLWVRNWQNRRSTKPGIEWELDAVQARIITIDNAAVVQQTVDSLPPALTDVVVIAETPLDIDGAEVLVVPAEFSCTATNKGRAVEWARRHHATDREYVLYLDEDTDASNLTGLDSNADIIQFRERPTRTGGLLPYLAEIHRIGFNVEQRSFPFFQLPFYAWGGGIAIRSSLEDAVTWDTPTIVEDSVFTWRAILKHNATLKVADVYLANQAPPSIWAMMKQRRRWLTGTRQRHEMLPMQYRLLYDTRDLGWALSTFSPLLWLASAASYRGLIDLSLSPLFFPGAYMALTLTLLGHVYAWSLLGLSTYRPPIGVWVLLLLLTPFIVTIHSIGALYGFLRPARTFAVTRKVLSSTDGGTDEPDASSASSESPTGDSAAKHTAAEGEEN